jgi:pimeloyl-ACP methyl ester carboxylesterase
MLQFQPPGFGQRVVNTSLGVMAYYTPVGFPWSVAREGDRPPLLFLHSLGGGSSAYEWSKVYPAFAESHSILAPDLVGWGQSAHPARDYRVEDYLAIITELIERTNSGPVTAFASSLTGGITVRLAIQRPDLFHQLILVCPSGYGDFGIDYSGGAAAQVAKIPGIDRIVYTLGAANELAIRSFLEQFLFAQRSRITPELVAAYLASAQQRQADYAALSSLRGDLCFDLARYLPQLTVPTTFIWGEKARFGKPDLGRRLAKLSPAIQHFYEIPDAGVLPHLEVPASVIGLASPLL